MRTTAGDVAQDGGGKGQAASAPRARPGFEDSVVLKLKKLPEGLIEASVQKPHRLLAKVKPEKIVEACKLLRNAGFDHLSCITCVDYNTELEMVYLMWSYGEKCLMELHATISGTEPAIRSVTSIWTGAEFHEREAFDMFGVIFEGCPNLTRVLLQEEWTVYPLRKSFKVESIHEKKKRLDAEKAKAAKAQAAPATPAAAPSPPAAEKTVGEKPAGAAVGNAVAKKEGEKI